MVAAAWVQVRLGLAPLRTLEASLARVRDGRSQRLEGRFPSELQPLVDDFNKVLDRNAEVVTRARTQAGNLAHAIKTPLAALAQAARPAQPPAELASLVRDQVELARRHVDWHLARSRAAAAQGVPGAVVPLEPVVQGLLRTLERVHADRHLDMRWTPPGQELRFAGETQDLQEMLGNLLDNACKWARGAVEVDAQRLAGDGRDWLVCRVDDDGPGIAPELRDRVTARGTRLDESVPGSGLGLAIVQEIAGLYGGSLALDVAPAGGLRAVLRLPAA
jgi:signal transduction histidine kinase